MRSAANRSSRKIVVGMDYYSLTQTGIDAREFDLRHTFESAQPLTFHADYDLEKNMISYSSGARLIKAQATKSGKGCKIKINSSDIASAKKEFVGRFRLNDDMNEIYSKISTDRFVSTAIGQYRGMRITLNDPWETTLCFIISQYNNVKRIRLIVKKFISEFGEPMVNKDGKSMGKSFPTSEVLTNFTEDDFKRCGAGFRARYVASAAELCTNNLDLYKLRGKNYDTTKEQLMEISGVGDKVADCIALMGYGKLEAFPIDVWVKRTMENLYFKGESKKPAEIHDFAEELWGDYRGYAQQYLFHYARNNEF